MEVAMWKVKRTIVIVTLFSVAFGALCWAGRNDSLSGRELLRAMRERDRGTQRPARAGRTVQRTSGTARSTNDEKPPTAMKLLDKSLGLGRGTQPYIIKFEILRESLKIRDGGRGPRQVYKDKRDCEMRSDGIRKYERIKYFKRRDSQWHQSRDSTLMYDGKSYIKHSLTDVDQIDLADDGTHDIWGWHPLVGFFHDEDGPLDSFLRRCRRISVRPGLERVGNSLCYVIDAVNAGRKYTIWIDPEHSYNIAKADVFKGEGAVLRDTRLKKGECVYDYLEILRFEKFKDVWVPMEARLEFGYFFGGTYGLYRETQHIRCTEVIPDPDHEAMRSFYPDEIPGGAEIRRISFSGYIPDQKDFVNYGFRWQPGAKSVVNREGRLVSNNPNKNVLPIVKVLNPAKVFETFKVEPPVSQPNGKNLLVCFWDINQAQSQHALLALRDRQATLAEKGVSVITVEASRAQTDKVRSWAEKNKVTFPVGTYYAVYEDFVRRQEDPEGQMPILSEVVSDLRMAWRTERLPWLILADRNQVVTAEGFGLEELDEKIKDAEEAEIVTNKIAHLDSQ